MGKSCPPGAADPQFPCSEKDVRRVGEHCVPAPPPPQAAGACGRSGRPPREWLQSAKRPLWGPLQAAPPTLYSDASRHILRKSPRFHATRDQEAHPNDRTFCYLRNRPVAARRPGRERRRPRRRRRSNCWPSKRTSLPSPITTGRVYGLPPLEVDADLMQSARQHATWMTLNCSLVHSNQPVAENIAMGQSSSEEVLQCWMNSSGHRANILNGGHRRIGVAAYRTPEGTIFWCQQFWP